jgi:galactonate dehydratase
MDFVRRHIGPDPAVMIDGHMGNSPSATWTLPIAQAVLNAIEPYDIFFFEEPLHYTDPQGYSQLCKLTKIPVAGGECLTGFCEWKVFIECDAFDIGQPDASFTGGLIEFMKVASMLESKGRRIATHSWGAGGSLMQNIHCGFACSNTIILELAPNYAGLHSEVMIEQPVIKDGFVLPPQLPGLGIQLTDKIRNKYPFVPGSGEFNDVPGKILVD